MNIFSCICVKFPSRKIDLENVSKYKMQMLKTRKLSKTKLHQMIKNKANVTDSSENANRKLGQDFNIGQKKNSRPKAHGIRTAA